ncbi:ABC transporter ATP-binding protein/permease, partial [Candidatus Bathyarchaeota archaeon]|nr:ABC transporter ATP-binding protein/permease [Candidatus Bathyarchaeota archaeon]
MSVAKPLLEYVESIDVGRSIRGTGREFRSLLKYNRPYIHLCAILILLSALRAYLFTLEPIYTSQIIDLVVVSGQYDQLPGLVRNIMLSVAGIGVVAFAQTFVGGYYAEHVIRDIRLDYYRSLGEKSFSFYDTSAVGDLISRATVDLQSVQTFLVTWVSSISDAVFIITAVFIVIFPLNPVMSLLSLLPMPVILYTQINLFQLERPLQKKLLLILGKLGAYVQQNIIGMKNVRIFRVEDDMEDGFNEVEGKYLETVIKIQHIQARYVPSVQAIIWVALAAIYIYGASLIVAPVPVLEVGQIVLFARYMQRLRDPLGRLSNLTGLWVTAYTGLERIDETINAPLDFEDRPDAKEVSIDKGEVEFHNVSFGYTKDRNILTDVSFKVQPGEKIAILGATGSGKTSLVYLIPRFSDVRSGSIKIDGVNIQDF